MVVARENVALILGVRACFLGVTAREKLGREEQEIETFFFVFDGAKDGEIPFERDTRRRFLCSIRDLQRIPFAE